MRMGTQKRYYDQNSTYISQWGRREIEGCQHCLQSLTYLTAPHEQKTFLSLKEIAMVCILWLQCYMYNRTTNYSEGMI